MCVCVRACVCVWGGGGGGGGGGVKFRIMLETSNLARISTHTHTHTYVVSENVPYVPFSTKALLIFLMSAFFAKNLCFLAKIVPLLKAIV